LVLSSFDEDGIQRLALRYRDHLVAKSLAITNEASYLDDLCYTLSSKRTLFTWRASIVANSLASLTESLGSRFNPVRSATNPRLAFIFTGQGAQWHAMGRELLAYPTFRESFNAAGEYLKELGCSWPLIGALI
jgi:acyl transferase domain-containing protein